MREVGSSYLRYKNQDENYKEKEKIIMKNNKGFSLVELIVVIAIMAVLVGVLAPQFIKYVENSRRATDVSTAESLRSAILADIADRIPGDHFASGSQSKETVSGTGSNRSDSCPSTVSSAPAVKGTVSASAFTVTWDAANGTCEVYVGAFCLTDPDQAALYKSQASSPTVGQN